MASLGIRGFHDLRAAYACDRYQQLTGYAAPAVVGARLADRETDVSARKIISAELGHGRIDVVAAYVGSAGFSRSHAPAWECILMSPLTTNVN